MTPQVRLAGKTDVFELSRIMSRAFYDDPVMTWLLPNDRRRSAQLYRLFTTLTHHFHLADGGVAVASDGSGIGAAALWNPPSRWQPTWRAELATMPTFLGVFGLRAGAALTLQKRLKQAHPEEPHWYLSAIGSDPAVRGRGFGQALLRSRLDRCDAEYCPAYLVSSKAENVPYYERFGFKVTRDIVLPDSGPTMWPMWRQPR
ncbi:GNAT family N-acetyltransferase [Mycobacterium sp.]|uniref:GNAT family N-acetyltransferase n=1 Tax=Mycobacterium sp. TaxID=1785 RepID=UPI003BAC1F6C